MSVIIASAVAALALVILLLIIIVKPKFIRPVVRKYAVATAAVYLSGTLFILLLAWKMTSLPMVFVIISEASVLSVFIITMFTIVKISKNIEAIMKAAEEGKIKGEDKDEDGENEEDGRDEGREDT